MIRLLFLSMLVLLSGCVGMPKVDNSKTDATCARECNVNYTNCIRGFHLFPLQNQWECGAGMKACVNTCPAPSQAAAMVAVPAPPTREQRLTELNDLLKKGLISQSDYDSKKVEILKAM